MTHVLDGHIEIDEQGVARIAGSRIKVHLLVAAKRAGGLTAEQLQESYPHLSMARIHAALAYYYDHKQEIDRIIQSELEETDRLRAEAGESPVTKRLRAEGLLPV